MVKSMLFRLFDASDVDNSGELNFLDSTAKMSGLRYLCVYSLGGVYIFAAGVKSGV
jgi:hypothetical protein